jgi:hypothetical protein
MSDKVKLRFDLRMTVDGFTVEVDAIDVEAEVVP